MDQNINSVGKNYAYEIKGGIPLKGDIEISGSKNAALGIIAASIMVDGVCTLENVPDIIDVHVMFDLLRSLGAKVDTIDSHTYRIDSTTINTYKASGPLVSRIRASYYLMGALLGRCGKASIRLPGGCNFGQRPIDLHLKAFQLMGAKGSRPADINSGIVNLEADPLHGARIYLDIVSVGATINAMLAACKAQGKTEIINAAKEPHIVDVANFLNSMGANVRGAGTDTIRVRGVKKLHGTTYSVIPDQIEAGTYMCLAAATEGDILIKDIIPKHLDSISAKLIDMGNNVIEYDEALRVVGCENEYPTQVKTLPYPGFPTDMQPQISAVLVRARGVSKVEESIFESRFKYVEELKKMGAKIDVKDKISTIEGVERLQGADLIVPDLRAGAALVIAALSASGKSTIANIEYIKRGYEDFENKLLALGADIKLIEE